LLDDENSRSKQNEMSSDAIRYEFASDNTAAICPEAWAALQEANIKEAPSYGDDRWTARVCDRVRELFETECDVYFVFNGTAANALALAQLCLSFHGVICHQYSHIQTDECGAPEFFTKGSKLFLVSGTNGSPQRVCPVADKIDLEQAEKIVARQTDLHSHKPRAISIAQATEFGTVYTRDEIAAIAQFTDAHDMFLHMDGARFANAVASLNCAPKAITWEVGVDVLCFGGTKNGIGAGELVIFFQKKLSQEFDYRLKQAGQLGSKMRFLAAPWLGLLTDGVWLRNAQHANGAARHLASRLRNEARIKIVFPVDANAIFARMHDQLARELHGRGWHFYKFLEPDIYRLMCSWATTDKAISEFVADIIAVNH
jgi:threonine aldolase